MKTDYPQIITPLTGKYNKSITRCLSCNFEMDSNNSLFMNSLGLADSSWGDMIVYECPVCFEKSYCHADDWYKDLLYRTISKDQNIFYDKYFNRREIIK